MYNVHVDKQKHDKTWLPFHAFISSPSGFYPARHLRTHYSSSLFAAWILKTLRFQSPEHPKEHSINPSSFLFWPGQQKRKGQFWMAIFPRCSIYGIFTYIYGNCRYSCMFPTWEHLVFFGRQHGVTKAMKTTPKVTPSERLPAILTEVSLACHYILVGKIAREKLTSCRLAIMPKSNSNTKNLAINTTTPKWS